MYITKLAPIQPPSASPNLFDYCLQVHLLSSLNLGLQVHLHSGLVAASQCSSELPRSQPPSASPNSFDDGLPVHLQTRSIMASKCISHFTPSWPPCPSPKQLDHSLQLYCQETTVGVQRYRCNTGGMSETEYVFGRPQGR